jgi:hypothetical protein
VQFSGKALVSHVEGPGFDLQHHKSQIKGKINFINNKDHTALFNESNDHLAISSVFLNTHHQGHMETKK